LIVGVIHFLLWARFEPDQEGEESGWFVQGHRDIALIVPVGPAAASAETGLAEPLVRHSRILTVRFQQFRLMQP
jgi:hypothetical protein